MSAHAGSSKHPLLPYLVAALAVAVTLAIRAALTTLLKESAPMMLLAVPIVVAGWYGGLRPALFCTAISFLSGWYFFVPEQHSFLPGAPRESVRLVIFGAVGFSLSLLSGRMHDSVARSRSSEAALRQNEEYLEAVVEALPVGVGVTDRQARILSMNGASLRMHGLTREDDFTQLNVREEFQLGTLDGRVLPLEEWPVSRASRGDYVSDYEVRLKRVSTGSERIIRYTAVPVGLGEGHAGMNVFVMQDVTGSRQAEMRLQESEARYRLLFDSIDEGFCVLQMVFEGDNVPVDYRFLQANPAFERHTGLTGAVGKLVSELVPNLDRSWFEIYGRVALTGESVRFQNDAPAMGRSFDVYAFRIGEPEIRTVALLFNDVTERKRNEEAVEAARRETESQRRLLDAVLESLPVGVIIVDGSGGVVRRNRAYETLWGLTGNGGMAAAAPKQQDWRGWWPDTGRRIAPHEWALTRAVHEGELVAGELVEIERFDGTGRRFVMNMAAPVKDDRGRVIAGVVAQTDVSERVEMERALRDSEDKFRTISDNIPQLAWMTDERGLDLWYNRRWFEYTGADVDEMQRLRALAGAGGGSNDEWRLAVIHSDDREDTRIKWARSLQTGEPYEIEFRCRRHDGVYRWFLGRALPIRDDSGRIVRWFGTNTDIHEQKITVEALRRSNEDLQQFAYVASHDLQEPLRTVVSFSQMLTRRHSAEMGEQSREYLGYVAEAALRMSALVRDLLAYSRATQDAETRREPVSLEDVLLRDVLPALHTLIAETEAQIEHDPLPIVAGDRTQLGQVLQNLLSNALKYRRNGIAPLVRIRSERCRGEWCISVIDNGEGFSQQFADQIFGIFKRLHGAQMPGTGIGLAICKRVVERHGGRIWAESEPGAGAAFHFTLPALPDATPGDR